MLDIQSLNISFGNKTVVQDLSFNLKKGTTLGIVGESGSGKSLTSLAIMGLLPTQAKLSGNILLNLEAQNLNLVGLEDQKYQKIRGKQISMIFQEPMTSLNPLMTCGSQVAEACLIHQKISKKEAKEQVLHWFEEVKLPNPSQLFQAYPHQISGGQKQRVMIAMAMINQPQILIADEPTTALDVTIQKTILQLMNDLQQKHEMSVIFISHDLGVISEVCQDILVMWNGKKIESGLVSDVLKSPTEAYTKGLLHCRPDLKIKPERLSTIQDFMDKSLVEVKIISDEEQKTKSDNLLKNEALLKVVNLQKTYKQSSGWFEKPKEPTIAVNHVNFEIYPGETLGLVGESGCGKTTLGRTLLRLIEADSGQIFYKNQDILKLKNSEIRSLRKEMQMIFQDPYASLNPRMTIGESITEPIWVHRLFPDYQACKKRTLELLDAVALLPEHFDRYPHEFSGGQRQRICIARALALNPSFIVCDECVSALDVSVQAQVLNLLNDLKKQFGLTYIFISHDLSVVKYMSDRILVMNQGEIVESGFSLDIYKAPKHHYTQTLLSAIPNINF